MKYGVIDIGTNTIRAVIYDVGEKIKKVSDLTHESEILKYTSDGILQKEGVKRLVESLYKSGDYFKKNNVSNVYCVATSAMRDVKNFNNVNEIVQKICNFKIELLSEEKEALCDFYAIKALYGDKCSGIGIDLGGGSCQVVAFQDGVTRYSKSFPIGVKRMYSRFGNYDVNINKKFTDYIKEITSDIPKIQSDTLYFMGGTAKSILKIATRDKEIKTNRINVNEIINPQAFIENKSKFINVDKRRINAIPYGIEIINYFVNYFSAKQIDVLVYGVREGYIASLLNN